MMLGLAAGEERRLARAHRLAPWIRDCFARVAPLIDLGMDRHACQAFLRSAGLPVPAPSNCLLCPYRSEIELLWLARFHPDAYAEWVDLEAAKLDRFERLGDRNLGVFGRRRLPEVLKEAERKYGHLSDADLEAYRMAHGHGVASTY